MSVSVSGRKRDRTRDCWIQDMGDHRTWRASNMAKKKWAGFSMEFSVCYSSRGWRVVSGVVCGRRKVGSCGGTLARHI